jgi:hypothetical protein
MKMAEVKLSKEELKSLYHYHFDIANDKFFACKTDHNDKVAEDRLKRAKRFKKLLKKHFGFIIEPPKDEEG